MAFHPYRSNAAKRLVPHSKFGIQAGLGFAFWIITARLFSTESVGLASSLISASNLIMFLGLLGMNTTSYATCPWQITGIG